MSGIETLPSVPSSVDLLRDVARAVEHGTFGDLADVARVACGWLALHDRQPQDVERRVTAGCSQPAVNKPQRVAGGRAMGSAGISGCTGRLARQVRYGGLKRLLRRVGGQLAVVKS